MKGEASMKQRKYPTSLFVTGLITNILIRFFWLFVPAIIMLILGIWKDTCIYIGIALLVLNIAISFIEQMKIRHTFLSDNDNPDFNAFQDALSKDGSWIENIQELVDSKIENNK